MAFSAVDDAIRMFFVTQSASELSGMWIMRIRIHLCCLSCDSFVIVALHAAFRFSGWNRSGCVVASFAINISCLMLELWRSSQYSGAHAKKASYEKRQIFHGDSHYRPFPSRFLLLIKVTYLLWWLGWRWLHLRDRWSLRRKKQNLRTSSHKKSHTDRRYPGRLRKG